MSKTQPARGMRDFLPADVRKRNYVINIIREVYESYGFEPLETPAVENLETLTGKYGEEGGQLMFKILRRGESLDLTAGERGLTDLALRYDLTVPLARVVANYRNELPRFFKRYQIQPVWRADRPARGRFREFYQCDVDAIGSGSMLVEAEQIAAVAEILNRLGFKDFTIRINDRELLDAMMEVSSIDKAMRPQVLGAIDKLDKIGVEGVTKELLGLGIPEGNIEHILFKITNKDFLADPGQNEIHKFSADRFTANNQMLDFFRESFKVYPDENPGKILAGKAIERLREIISLTGNLSCKDYIKFDPSLARGLSYYTGAIFEINVPDLAGSLGGGGRYDGLIGMFGKEQIPACGFSLGLERILVVMDERGMFPPELRSSSADVLVTVWNAETAGESLRLAGELRQAGLRVLVYPEPDKFGKQFKYAAAVGVRFVAVLGESELADNTVTIKNMATGEQQTVGRSRISDFGFRIVD
ncbi:MAG: histidine--tRNA ligase [Acidobacteria bacterium]|nr:histidine--tRNA ligase [Acidobacteriota bacterium]